MTVGGGARKFPVCRLAGWWPFSRLPEVLADHREHCLRCQVTDTRRRSLDRGIAALRGEMIPAPPTLQAAVVAGLGVQDAANPRRRLMARVAARYAAAGVTAATAVALLTGVARWRSRPVG